VFVGDRPFDDISGANAVGMRTVLRRNGLVPDYDAPADAEIAALPELVDLVRSWD
jgi:putative hydrolase of the HAD superfamily